MIQRSFHIAGDIGSTLDVLLNFGLAGTVNRDPVRIGAKVFPPGCLMLETIACKPSNGGWDVTVTLATRQDHGRADGTQRQWFSPPSYAFSEFFPADTIDVEV